MAVHGLSRLTPWDISGRVGINKLWFPDVREGLEGADAAKEFMTGLLGPVAGIGINAAKGYQEISEGRVLKGWETMMPTVIKNGLKAFRYGSEGNIDKSGIAINDEVGGFGVAGQVVGFSPSETRLAQEGKSAILNADRAIQSRRSDLLRDFALSYMASDDEGKAEARQAIVEFNKKNPNVRITPANQLMGIKARRRRISQAKNGVYLPPKRRAAAMEAGRFADDGE